jgi:hypothetical protein
MDELPFPCISLHSAAATTTAAATLDIESPNVK